MENSSNKIDYRFQYLPSKHFETMENKDIQESLMKWSMKNRMKIQAFSFDKPFHRYQKQSFVESFFSDPNVTSNLETLSSNGHWTPLNTTSAKVDVTEVSSSVTSMSFFDRLYGGEVVREGGTIIRCQEEYSDIIDNYVDDELKKMILSEDSEHWALYSEEERKELLFLLLGHLLVGGALCQCDEEVNDYLKVAKTLYRDLIVVYMCDKKVIVSTVIFKVSVQNPQGDRIYPCSEQNYQNFAYMCVDPFKKQVLVLYHRYGVSLPSIK